MWSGGGDGAAQTHFPHASGKRRARGCRPRVARRSRSRQTTGRTPPTECRSRPSARGSRARSSPTARGRRTRGGSGRSARSASPRSWACRPPPRSGAAAGRPTRPRTTARGRRRTRRTRSSPRCRSAPPRRSARPRTPRTRWRRIRGTRPPTPPARPPAPPRRRRACARSSAARWRRSSVEPPFSRLPHHGAVVFS